MVSKLRKRAFTIIELLVVCVIISVLATMVLSGIQHVNTKTMSLTCLSRMKDIGTGLKTYIALWKGWTPPNGHHYPALMGMPVYDPADPAKFDENVAGKVEAFVCPAEDPKEWRQFKGTGGQVSKGYNRSFNLGSGFVGRNTLRSPGRTVMISEFNAPRHPNGVKLGLNYLFSDMSGKVSGGTISDPEYMPGLMTNWFANVQLNNFIESDGGNPDLVMVWSEPLTNFGSVRYITDPSVPISNLRPVGKQWHPFSFLPTLSPNWDGVGAAGEPNYILGIWSGLLDFPASGKWTIQIRCDDVGGVIIDENDNGILEWAEFLQQGTAATSDPKPLPPYDPNDPNGCGWWIRPREREYDLPRAGLFPVFIYLFDWEKACKGSNIDESIIFSWQNSAEDISMQVIPPERMLHSPFGNSKLKPPVQMSFPTGMLPEEN